MQNLFKVDGQTLTPIEVYDAVSDTVNYLTFAFMFSYDWAGLTKSAIFTKGTDVYEVVLTDDEVLESDHVNLSAGVWEVSVVGDAVVDAVVTRQITTSSYNYTVTQSGATSGGVFPPSIASQVYINTNQATPQTFVGGIPKLAADRVISDDHHIVDKKHVADAVAAVTADDFAHNSLSTLQGGSATERYHMTQAENTALHAHSNKTALDAVAGVNTGDQAASSFNHNDLANKQGGTTNEFYHVTAAEKTVVANTSGTNTGDQDVSGAISTHDADAGAHTILARKTAVMQKLITKTVAAGENISAITWTQDDAGTALALLDFEIRIMVPANSIGVGTTGYIYARLNDRSTAGDYTSITALAQQTAACVFRTNYGKGIIRMNLCSGGYYVGELQYTYYDGATHSANVTTAAVHFSAASITKIYLFLSASGLTYIPEGTVIEVYGRTA